MSEENLDEGEGIKSLRKSHDELKKQNDQLLTELQTFRTSQRQSAVADILKAKGVPASAAKLYTGEDTSEDAVGKWVTDFADVFNVQNSNDANAQNARRVANASFGTADAFANTSREGQPVMGNPEEIMRALNTLPRTELERLGYLPVNPNIPEGK